MNISKIAIHITFFFAKERLIYLNQVLENLLEIPCEKKIFIYSNQNLDQYFSQYEEIEVLIYPYNKHGKRDYNELWHRMGMINLFNPFYLSWENRKVAEKIIDEYDAQIYLEDDLAFNKNTLDYWLTYKDLALKYNYNLGFLRIENDSKNDFYLTDLAEKPKKAIILDQQIFLVNDVNPYYGFWIYDKNELKEFVKTNEWKFDFKGYDIREKSAIGWHGVDMGRYKATIIPLEKISEDLLQTVSGCTVHHLPNNYIDQPVFCTIKSPLTLEANQITIENLDNN